MPNDRKRIIRRQTHRRSNHTDLKVVIPAAAMFIIATVFVITMLIISKNHRSTSAAQSTPAASDTIPAGFTTPATDIQEEPPAEEPEEVDTPLRIPEEDIYSFLQGPKAWKKRKTWSGTWADEYTDIGLKFGSFGCGHCCIAGIYDTLSPYKISPLDAFEFSRKHSVYYPTKKSGAIGWEAMSDSLDQMGVNCSLKRKPKDYSTFQYKMNEAVGAVILLHSDDPDSFWGHIKGHYVTIWNYDPEEDTVFLANPGDYKLNRKTIDLKKCYDYLKDVSSFQIMYIYGYDEAFDTWQPESGIKEKWVAPQ